MEVHMTYLIRSHQDDNMDVPEPGLFTHGQGETGRCGSMLWLRETGSDYSGNDRMEGTRRSRTIEDQAR